MFCRFELSDLGCVQNKRHASTQMSRRLYRSLYKTGIEAFLADGVAVDCLSSSQDRPISLYALSLSNNFITSHR